MALPPGPRSPAIVNSLRFAYRPLSVLREWRRRFGDVFTVRMLGFGVGVYVADPQAIRELFTGDQSDLRAGEANSFMEPVLGSHSVLVLDGPRHLRQRKLLLPPFQGSSVVSFREVTRDVAEREISSWRPGTASRAARADARLDLRGDLPRRVRRHPRGSGGEPARAADRRR